MPARPPGLRYGRIVWATFRDRNGFRKDRPAVVLTPTGEVADDVPLVLMGVTTRFAEPPPPNHVPLPWNPDPRRVGTRLARRSAAVVDWLDTCYADEVIDLAGDVPGALMAELRRRVQELRDADDAG